MTEGGKLVKRSDGTEAIMLGRVILKEKPSRKRARRTEWQFSHELQRIREIEEIIRHRHGGAIPDPGSTDDRETCLAYLRAVALTPCGQQLASWAAMWAPWVDPVTLATIEALGFGKERMLKADTVAKMLFVTMAERTTLGLKTVGACDVPKAKRKAIAKQTKRDRDRKRQEDKRRAAGMVDRKSQQAASLASTKPWDALGVSRRTWFYRQQKANCTAVSPIVIKGNSDTPVQKVRLPVVGQQTHTDQRRAAGLIAGLGDHPPAGLQGAAPHGSVDTQSHAAA